MAKHTIRHLISLDDLSDTDVRDIVERGAVLARRAEAGQGVGSTALAGDVVGVYFRKTSTRTRTAFSAGALRLGAGVLSYGPDDLQLNTGETTDDTGRVMSGMLDVLVARTAGDPQEMRAWAAQRRMAVVNAMSSDEHPTQALYGLAPAVLARARERAAVNGSTVAERHDLADLPADFDAAYTTRWKTTGTSKQDPHWRRAFAPFQVSGQLMEHAPKAVFMHDLPAHRGEEVTAEVLDGPSSIAFQQAENKLYSAMAVLEWCRDAR
jgi:ornithine carbamoyltransferase